MTEPDQTTPEDEVDDGSEQILSSETNNIHVQVPVKPTVRDCADMKWIHCHIL